MLFFRDYLIHKYGRPLYRVPVSLPLLCPHRIINSEERCIFCAEDGALARHLSHDLKINEQINKGINYIKNRYGCENGYIAYFQAFTSTNAPAQELSKYYNETLKYANFTMAIIATRPDCLPEEIIELLSELNRKIDLWIELGVQTANDKTLAFIQRGHDFKCVVDSTAKLAEKGIKTAAHVIIGLPGENGADFENTAKKIASLPFSAVKIHNLLILKNTALAKMYAENRNFVQAMDEYEYAIALKNFIKLLPAEWPLMRIVADADPRTIIAPKWRMSKGQFIEYFKEFYEHGNAENRFHKIRTEDGSYTMYHPRYKELFHTRAGASSEAFKKFIYPCHIMEKLKNNQRIRILDIGFGLGYNAISSAICAEEISKGYAEIISLENEPDCAKFAETLFPLDSINKTIIRAIIENNAWNGKYSEIKIIYSDARLVIKEKIIHGSFDAIFLDAFSTEKNTELWTFDFIRELASLLANNGIIATYSSALPVRGAFLRAGLFIGKSEPFGRKRCGTTASKNQSVINQLPKKEIDIIMKSTAGLAYRDLGLNRNRTRICEFRKKTVERLRKRNIPKWFKTKDCIFSDSVKAPSAAQMRSGKTTLY